MSMLGSWACSAAYLAASMALPSSVIISPAEVSLQPIADTTGAEIRWFGVNGPRSDAEILSREGREWRVVFMTDTAQRVTELWMFERPEPFQGVRESHRRRR